MIPMIGAKSDFSLGESIVKPKRIVKDAAEMGYTAVSIADSMNANALIGFFGQCQESSIKGIFGVTLRVVDDLAWRRAGRGEPKAKPNRHFCPTLYAINKAGMSRIMKLLTLAHSETHFYYQAQIDLDDLLKVHRHGDTILTTGSAHGLFFHRDHAGVLAQILKRSDRRQLRVEVAPVNTRYYDQHNYHALVAADANDLECIITRPVLNNEGGASDRNTLESILSRDTVDSMWRSQPAEDLHVKSPKDVVTDFTKTIGRLFVEHPDLKSFASPRSIVTSTQRFPDLFDYQWQKEEISLPDMAADPSRRLAELCLDGWASRIASPMMGYQPAPDLIDGYKDRLRYELGVLARMGFENYFLLVREVVVWSKESDIMVGPGRGSAGGSLVSYLLGITDVDPIRFGLIFERFINPERLDLPDIDLDFMSTRRHEVVEWLSNTYGHEHVAGIANYNLLGAASALRQVASAHNIHESEYRVSKQLDQGANLEEARTTTPDLEKFAAKHPKVWQQAVALQGVFRNYGQHAAGIIVAKDKIANRAVVDARKGFPLVNWDKNSVEDMGLVKLDVLGLSTLDLLAHAKRYVHDTTGERLEYTSLPLDDKAVLKAFGEGLTAGIFQFEGGGMRHLLKELAMGEDLIFDDLVATTALFRPGPLESGLCEQFVQIKQGARLEEYIHPSMRPALEPTKGIVVYQEQVMQLSRDLAGFTMAEADGLRKAMGKKKPEEMAKQRDHWIAGCLETSGMEAEVSGELFHQIEKFAGYAFNKSHSVEYAVISYWSMYVKTHYPAAFFAAALTILDEEKRPGLVKNALEEGIKVLPPDINISSDRFEIGPDLNSLYAPFQMIKGVSDKGVESIIKAKAAVGGRFASKQEFIDTVNRRVCNSRVQLCMEAIGVFASLDPDSPSSTDPSRLKDQKEMLPGLMVASVKADRAIGYSKEAAEELRTILIGIYDIAPKAQEIVLTQYEDDEADDAYKAIKDFNSVIPYMGPRAKIMIICDAPTYTEVNEGKMGEGDAAKPLLAALRKNGISKEEVYITSLVRCGKPKGKDFTNSMVSLYSPFLDAEIEALKPPVIVCLGGKAIRHISPDAKGKWEELAGQSSYDKKRDATLIFGFNPSMIHFEPSRQALLNSIFAQAKSTIS